MHNSMVLDPGDFAKKRVKKDMLWKPLFRRFRQFFRLRMSSFIDIKMVIESQFSRESLE